MKKLLLYTIFSMSSVLLLGCTKSQIKRNACTGDSGTLDLDSCSIFFNNLFTPNGDVYNENFPLYCNCPAADEFLLIVQDGNKILFQTSDPNGVLWNGKTNGKEVIEGVYDYTFDAKIGNINSTATGTITLIRDISEPIKIYNGSCLYIYQDPIVVVK